MTFDIEHYQLHWEFFKSVNPKADELFFIDLQLEKINKVLKDALETIDFSNDYVQTIEEYLNELERQNFFFQKEYKEYLETKKSTFLKLKNKEFLPFEKVFFVHYQCDNFNEGEQITALCIYSKGKVKEYSGSEAVNIKEYATKVNDLLNEGLILVHWNQDRPNYGTDHIVKRYYNLTGDNLELEYRNEINLAEWLIFKYGQNYISHPRLDNLAKLNEFYGIRETELGKQTFATNRLLLLTKIYFNTIKETLKTDINDPEVIIFDNNEKKDLTTQKWFSTGISLATGEAFDLYRKLGNKPTAICKNIKVPVSNKPYISSTINDTNNAKNIFKDTKKLKALHKYITDNGLNFGTEFLAKYNQIEPD